MNYSKIVSGSGDDPYGAVRFYGKSGFRLVMLEEMERLLRKYWSIPERQTETSVVLADRGWFEDRGELSE